MPKPYLGSLFLRLLYAFTVGSLVWSLLVSPGTAAPTGAVFKRACPSIDELAARIRDKGMTENMVFYTSPVSKSRAEAFCTTLSPGGNWYESVWPFDEQRAITNECDPTGGRTAAAWEELLKKAPRMSAAMASAATGKAYVLMPSWMLSKGREGSIWASYEFPYLMRNPAVTAVIRVDPDDIDDLGAMIWRAGDPIDLPITDPQNALRRF